MEKNKIEKGHRILSSEVYFLIEEQPELDASQFEPEYVKVTYGHWIKLGIRENEYRCSYCGNDIRVHNCNYDFCPNCASVMENV